MLVRFLSGAEVRQNKKRLPCEAADFARSAHRRGSVSRSYAPVAEGAAASGRERSGCLLKNNNGCSKGGLRGCCSIGYMRSAESSFTERRANSSRDDFFLDGKRVFSLIPRDFGLIYQPATLVLLLLRGFFNMYVAFFPRPPV